MLVSEKNVLIIEDDVDLAETIGFFCEEKGFHPWVVHNGELAGNYLDDQAYDAIILDLVMPKVDGFRTMEIINQHQEGVPVIVHTSLDESSDKEVMQDMGAVAFFTKNESSIQEMVDFMEEYFLEQE